MDLPAFIDVQLIMSPPSKKTIPGGLKMGNKKLSTAIDESTTKKIIVVDNYNFLMASITNNKSLENTKKIYGDLDVVRIGTSSSLTSIRVLRQINRGS